MVRVSCSENRHTFFGSLTRPVAIFVLMLAGVGSTLTKSLDPSSQGTFTIPLSRKAFAVKRKGKIVSEKTTYSGQISIGSPLQHFQVVFDTGSGHVVLPSTECETKACTNHRRYNRSLSKDAVDINIDKSVIRFGEEYDEITVNYGTGQIVGSLVIDNVCLGEVCTRMGMITANQLSHNPFAYFPVDGIFGLGLGSLALDPDFSFFNMVARNGNVKVAQFAMYIGEGDDDSELAVGGFNHDRLASPMTWTPVARADLGYWQVDLKAIHIGDQTLEMCKDGNCRAILDTGTSHLGAPSSIEQLIDDLLSTPAKESDNCLLAQGKTISFELESFNLTLQPGNYMRHLPLDDYIIENTTKSAVTKKKKKKNSDSTNRKDTDVDRSTFTSNLMSNNLRHDRTHIWCRPLLMPVDLPEPMGPKLFILGEPILRKYYTVFDSSVPALGFGLAKEKTVEPVEEDTLILMQQSVHESDDHSGFAFVQMTIVTMKRSPPKSSDQDVGARVKIL